MLKTKANLPFPLAHIFANKTHKRFDFCSCDVLLQQFAVIVQQRRDGILGEDIVSNLLLHKAKMLGNIFLYL